MPVVATSTERRGNAIAIKGGGVGVGVSRLGVGEHFSAANIILA
jgi:hypothetical protein